MSNKRIVIAGRVHGVGFRHWMVAQAQVLGLAGWVRNRRDGTVEALIVGDTPAVEELLRACRRGPSAASVTSIEETMVDEDAPGPGFVRLPTS